MVLNRILRAGEGKILRRLKVIADHINTLEPDYVEMTDAELRAQTDVFRERLADGETLDHILPEAFAVVREAAKRVIGQRHFDVQMMGGAALHMGYIAEMKTGEGKTLVSTLPAYLNALTGDGVHLVTVNDYLVKYHAEWMGRVHRFLGLEVGMILAQMPPAERRTAYAADITYGTNNEFGFDYLRDNMAWSRDDLVQLRPGGRGRLDPHRRGEDAADHQRSGRAERPVVPGVRPARADAQEGHRLRGRGEQANGRDH